MLFKFSDLFFGAEVVAKRAGYRGQEHNLLEFALFFHYMGPRIKLQYHTWRHVSLSHLVSLI